MNLHLCEYLLVSAVCNTPDNDYYEFYLDNPSHLKSHEYPSSLSPMIPYTMQTNQRRTVGDEAVTDLETPYLNTRQLSWAHMHVQRVREIRQREAGCGIL